MEVRYVIEDGDGIVEDGALGDLGEALEEGVVAAADIGALVDRIATLGLGNLDETFVAVAQNLG